MIMFKRGKVHNGTLVFAEPLSLPEGAEVIVHIKPTDARSVINIDPQEILGKWRAGYALDFHTVSSQLLPDEGYDTERTEIGEMVYQAKYRSDRSKIQLLAEIAAKFVIDKFEVNGYRVLDYLDAVIPVPRSNPTKNFRPVSEIAEEIGRILYLPVHTNYLIKVRPTRDLKNVPDSEKPAELKGTFAVESHELQPKVVLLIDDLYDSGATLTELTDVLHKEGGVYRVLVLTLTRTRKKR